MKITFIFTSQAELTKLPPGARISSNFEVPDAAKSLPDIQEQIIALGKLVAQFTYAYVHINCPDIGIKNQLIPEDKPQADQLFYSVGTACIYFEGSVYFADGRSIYRKRIVTIYAPVRSPFPPLKTKGRFARKYYSALGHRHEQNEMGIYTQNVLALSDQLLSLLNIDTRPNNWRCLGFHPALMQKTLLKKYNQRQRKAIAAVRSRGREEEKRHARESKQAEKLAANPPQELTHGAGRTVGARPGIYKGIRMRSQLEIRFAAELDERGIKWVYEGEALGAASYLVDFYLPDLSAWVEVKGRFEARDRQVLPEVAKTLKTERQHRLLVYTGAGKCCVVNPSGFRDVERKNFWAELVR